MPRGSRHKSSKHSTRESREYSDSEKDSSLRDKIVKEDSGSARGSKELTSGEKRKMDSKSVDGRDIVGSGSGEQVPSSKRRKDKVENDRWTGGGDDERVASRTDANSKDPKGVVESKSRSSRREDNPGPLVDADEGGKKGVSVSKGEQKHYRSSDRKDKGEKEVGPERERKAKDASRSERFVDIDGGIDIIGTEGGGKKGGLEDEHSTRNVAGNNGLGSRDELRKPEDERELERRVRRKRDSSGDGDKHQDGVRETDDKRLSSKDDSVKSGKCKDEVLKGRYKDDTDKDIRYQDEKQRDGHHTRDYSISRSDDKYLRNEKRDLDAQSKKSKAPDGGHDNDRIGHNRDHHDHDRELDDRDNDRDHQIRDRERGHDRGRDRDRENDRDRDREHDRGRDLDRDKDRDHDRDRDHRYRRDRDRFRDRDLAQERSRDRDHDDRDYSSHLEDRSSRYKEDRRRRRSPDEYDDYYNDKSRSSKREGDRDRERSLSRRSQPEAITGSSRGRASPSSKSHVGTDKFRDATNEDAKYGDSVKELTSISEAHERSSRYRPNEKRARFDDNHLGDLSAERSPGNKASPMGVMERSPSSTSIDRKYMNRAGRRQSLDVDETERRSSGSNDVRDASLNEDRLCRDLSSKKFSGEEYFQVDSMSHHRSGQANLPSHVNAPHSFRAGADSPSFLGSMGDDGRVNSSRYRRSVDPNIGRLHGNPWKGVPNWPSPLPNGFMPFPPGPHGPPHGGFSGMIPQYPSPIFGVRPSLEMSHPAIPYMPDADRFPGHARSLGWQNMVDGSGPSHFHGWNANNGVLMEESSIYGSGHQSNGRGKDMNSDAWKQNGEHYPSAASFGSQKDGHLTKAPTDEPSTLLDVKGSQYDNNHHPEEQGKDTKTKTVFDSSVVKEAPIFFAKPTGGKTSKSSPDDDDSHSLRVYLSMVDFSTELLPPDVYIQCKNAAGGGRNEDTYDKLTVGQSEDICEEMVEPLPLKESGSVALKFSNPVMGLDFLPMSVDLAFKRAVDMYKPQSIVKSSSQIPDCELQLEEEEGNRTEGEQEGDRTESEQEGDRTESEQEGNRTESVHTRDQQMQEQSVSVVALNVGLLTASGDKEIEGFVSPTNAEAEEDNPSYSPELKVPTLETANASAPAVAAGGEMAERLCHEPSPEIVEEHHRHSIAETVPQNVTMTDAAAASVEDSNVVGKSIGIASSSHAEPQQLGGTVSGSFNLPHGSSVNVCEALMSASNESESVILSRIHNAPESTH